MPVQILDDYPTGTRNGNSCSSCSAGRRELRDTDTGALRLERIVDLGIGIDMEGYLMLCEQCVLEAARMLGYVDPKVRDAAVDHVKALEVELARASAERDEAKLLVRLIRDYDHSESVLSDDGPDLHESAINADSVHESVQPVVSARKTKARTAKATA
jgi:hypothetical protein